MAVLTNEQVLFRESVGPSGRGRENQRGKREGGDSLGPRVPSKIQTGAQDDPSERELGSE